MVGDSVSFDSLHKFLVSMGIVLCVIPFVGSHLISAQGDTLIIPEEDYAKLHRASQVLVDERLQVIRSEYEYHFLMYVLFIPAGIGLVIVGLMRWRGVQGTQDRKEEIDLERQERELSRVSEEDVQAEKAKEYEKTFRDGADGKSAGASECVAGRSNTIKTAIEVEDKCLSRLETLLPPEYTLEKRTRIAAGQRDGIDGDRVFFDAVGIPASQSAPYLLIEVNYVWPGSSEAWKDRTERKIYRCADALRRLKGDNIICLAIIVAEESMVRDVSRGTDGIEVANLPFGRLLKTTVPTSKTDSFSLWF